MKNLKAKLRKNGGFTLIEMLIVVAIIAILVAISIPLVGSALENARKATDAANERAFKAALVSGYLLNEADMRADGDVEVEADTPYAYDVVNGRVSKTATSGAYGKSKDVKGMELFGIVGTDGSVKMQWGTNGTLLGASDIKGDNLLSPGMVKETT